MLRGPFRFDTDRHIYTVGATVVPGIHTVLREAGLEDGPQGGRDAEYFKQRGRAIHKATLLHDLGAFMALPSEWEPMRSAYIQLRREVRCRWLKLEHPKVHRQLRYASILDRVGYVSGRPAVVEIKTGYPAAYHGPQLAGGDLLLTGRVAIGLRRRLAFYLREDGTYQVKEYEDSADYGRFMDAVQNYWKEREEVQAW